MQNLYPSLTCTRPIRSPCRIASTTSWPFTTFPNTVCFPFKCGPKWGRSEMGSEGTYPGLTDTSKGDTIPEVVNRASGGFADVAPRVALMEFGQG